MWQQGAGDLIMVLLNSNVLKGQECLGKLREKGARNIMAGKHGESLGYRYTKRKVSWLTLMI